MSEPAWVTDDLRVRIGALQSAMEGHVGIFTNRGVLLVRVSNIRAGQVQHSITADIEEVPTPGLEGPAPFLRDDRGVPRPMRWQIHAGIRTCYSERGWNMGYGGWAIKCEADTVAAFRAMAAQWPSDVHPWTRYTETCAFLRQPERFLGHTPYRHVFPDEIYNGNGLLGA